MISKSADMAGTIPVSKITPLIPATIIGDTAGEAVFRLEQLRLAQALSDQLVKGQVYQGKVIAKLDDQVSVVNLNGTVVKMALGANARIGESLSLKFLGGSPKPAFLLSPSAINQEVDLTTISHTAQMIDQFLGSSEARKAPARFEAQTPITSSPFNPPQVIANDLKNAVAHSGLFYESHLVENAEGKRPLSALLLEPQNKMLPQNKMELLSLASLQNQATSSLNSSSLNSLVPQQLSILENQKLTWHGEVWPHQLMELEIQQKRSSDQVVHNHQQSSSPELENDNMDSQITLHLPNLGSVTARINLQNGKMRIQVLANELSTSTLLKDQKASLAQAIEASGQSLDYLSVLHHEQPAQS
jgi:hypothetical protein